MTPELFFILFYCYASLAMSSLFYDIGVVGKQNFSSTIHGCFVVFFTWWLVLPFALYYQIYFGEAPSGEEDETEPEEGIK